MNSKTKTPEQRKVDRDAVTLDLQANPIWYNE